MIGLIISAIVGLVAALGTVLRPGVNIQVATSAPPRSAPTDTGTWFVVGLADQGRTDKPVLIRSLADFVSSFGNKVSYSVLYDALDLFFREGGGQAYISRVVGPGATKGSLNLVDGVPATSLVVTALGAGAFSSNITIQVIAGIGDGTYQIQVYYAGTLMEQSGDLTTQQDAVTWAETSNYISIALGSTSTVPVVQGPTALSAGNDDRANIVDDQWLNALNLFTQDLGPGNVSAPGRTTDAGHQQLCDHAAIKNRVAILDAPDSPTAATLETSATNAKATAHGQYGAMFAPWIVIPGTVAGTTRTVPPSALVAGRCAVIDASDGPGTPAAGSKGVSTYAIGLSQVPWDATTRDALNTAGVNVIRMLFGAATIYGWRSLADPVNNTPWLDLGTVRYLMGLAARCWNVGQQFVFDPIDGQGHTIAAYGGALTSLVTDDWNAGEIYGATSQDAFNVDVGPSVNTPTTIAGNQLIANVSVRPSPMAELVTIQIVNTPITQTVA